jgi:hypothetical protein
MMMENVVYGTFGVICMINLFLLRKSSYNNSECCLNIEWDIDEEQFIVKMPKTFGGVHELRINPSNF